MNKNCRRQASIHLTKPFINGYMSIDGSRDYHHDLSELKYITSIPYGEISYDLNYNMEKAVKRTTDDNIEKISLMLRFILDQKDRLKFLDDTKSLTFITYRRTLISVMCSAVNPERLCILATLFNNCIYLCSMMTEDEVERKMMQSDQEKKFCAWGYKFEQYMSSDSPDILPDIEKPVVENAEFSMYYCSQLEEHRLFYGAQIDGLLATEGAMPRPSDVKDVENNLNYLRSNSYVELKTNREIQHWKQEANFKKRKLLRCWCQCYLANLKGLLVGFRNDEGIIQRLQWFNTEDIVKYCKNEWNPQTALNYLNYFLSYVKDAFKSLKNTCDSSTNKPLTLQFDIDRFRNINVTRVNDEFNTILPDWYLNINTCNK